MTWSISIDDENYGESVSKLVREESAIFKKTFVTGNPKTSISAGCKAFFAEVKNVITGNIKEEDLLPVFLKEGPNEIPIKDFYELQVPGFKAFFRINFETGQGKAIYLFRDPPDPGEVERLIRKWRHLE